MNANFSGIDQQYGLWSSTSCTQQANCRRAFDTVHGRPETYSALWGGSVRATAVRSGPVEATMSEPETLALTLAGLPAAVPSHRLSRMCSTGQGATMLRCVPTFHAYSSRLSILE